MEVLGDILISCIGLLGRLRGTRLSCARVPCLLKTLGGQEDGKEDEDEGEGTGGADGGGGDEETSKGDARVPKRDRRVVGCGAGSETDEYSRGGDLTLVHGIGSSS